MQFNFQFGNKRPDKREIIKVSIIVSIFIAILSSITGITENKLWDLLDEFQRKYIPLGILNEIIIKDPDKVNRRTERDVDKAIDKVIKEYDRIIMESDEQYKEQYIEEENDESLCYSEDCKKLSPPMRVCSPIFEGSDCSVKFMDK
jgi:hypothetical protein